MILGKHVEIIGLALGVAWFRAVAFLSGSVVRMLDFADEERDR